MVRVEWNDILAELNTTENPGIAPAITLGFLEESNEHYIAISTTIFSNDYPGGYSDRICIPRGCITKIVNLIEVPEQINKEYEQENKQNSPF